MSSPSRTTRVFTGKVRPHRYLYRIPKPGGYYEYVYLEDLAEEDATEEEETNPIEAMLRSFFIKVAKKVYGVKGETMATRFLNGLSITVTEKHYLDRLIVVLLEIIPKKYKKEFRALISEAKAND